jgi:predicted O-methyltransferase YrrM
METPSPEVLAIIEEALAGHQVFGDSAYILSQLEVAFARRLERVSTSLPVAGEVLSAFRSADSYTRYRLAGNTVARCAVQHAYTQLETGKQVGLPMSECENVLQVTLTHLLAGRTGSPYENGPIELKRLGNESFHGWIWTDDYPDDVLGRAFRKILDIEYGSQLCSIDDDELAMLRKGEELLRELVPLLSVSALTHAHQIGCFPDTGFWKGKVSSSQIRMGGTIFLNRKMLRNPWCTAEHLLHESLHQKLYDFRHGHSLLDVDAPLDESPRVVSLWNAQEFNRANHRDTHRAFAAFPVYVQRALLATLAERRAAELEERFGPYCGLIESRKALDRARYLGEKLKDQCRSHLGLAGMRMREWLMKILDNLDPASPPEGAYIHLLLDLYTREANRIEGVLGNQEVAIASFSRDLVPAAKAEIEAARGILTAIGAHAEQEQLENDLQTRVGGDLARNFPAVRRLIARTLLQASPDRFGLNSRAIDGSDPDALVRQMVEGGSDRLYLMQANVPALVAGAKRRAKDMRFLSSCEDQVGRLLSVLAAAVPPNGRILEVGTGAGVGLAWIVTGLRARQDVEIVTIEGDLPLAQSVKDGDWPSQVKIVVGDARELLPGLGHFDLVFADAAPVKYGDVETTLKLLRNGGVLVVDDLCATPDATEQQMLERDGLRLSLLRHPELQAVELEWSNRVILATKVGSVAEATENRKDTGAKVVEQSFA